MRGAILLVIALLAAGCTTPADPEPAPTQSTAPASPSSTSTSVATTSNAGLTVAPTPVAPSGAMKVVFVDVGQGAAVIIQTPDAVILNDVGRNSQASAAAIKAVLQDLGATAIDAMIITNPDADHAGGCDDIYQAYPVKALYHPGAAKDTQTWTQCLNAAAAEGTPVHTDDDVNPGDYLTISTTAAIRVLNIAKDAENINSGSIAVRLDYGEMSWIFPGDIECDEEDEILARGYDVDVDFIQAAHHGSAGSTCTNWLAAATPSHALIPVGATNQYGHPSPAALDRITAAGAQVLRTDLHGRITWTSDGTTYTIATERQPMASSTSTTTSASGSTTAPPPPTTGGGDVQISNIYYAPPSGSPLTEYVELQNQGSQAASMGGWTIRDEAGTTYTFPSGFSLAPGASVKVYTGTGSNTATELYWNRGTAVWNNSGGDTAYLYNGATLMDSWHYE